MAELDMNLVKKGMKEPREGLRDQGVVSAGLARNHAAALAACGWTADATAEIDALVEALGSKVAQQAEARIAAKGTTADERAARAAAKELIGKVRLGASIVLGREKVPGVTLESFEAGHALGQSTPKIAMYLEKVAPAVEAIDERLMPFFGGEKASLLMKAARASLDGSQATQEVSVATVPRETQEIYEIKGRLLKRIEELNKVGKIAFYGQNDIMGQFNKDVLNRSRKSRKAEAGDVTTDAP
ncbi:MAG: hypothetical protein M0R80_21720 [Proteobacteria bacterium]|jgi:hypothetical protein|nr:hypothetical protein [Pseudomonadota bacterium]